MYHLFIGFPRQQWFRESATILRYAYIACIVTLGKQWLSCNSFTLILWHSRS
jgi:hypothetical protein